MDADAATEAVPWSPDGADDVVWSYLEERTAAAAAMATAVPPPSVSLWRAWHIPRAVPQLPRHTWRAVVVALALATVVMVAWTARGAPASSALWARASPGTHRGGRASERRTFLHIDRPVSPRRNVVWSVPPAVAQA